MLDLDVYDYIETLQRAVYRSSEGKIRPRECLGMTLSEIIIVLEEGNELLDERLILHADLKTSILNGPHFGRKDKKPYILQNFLPKPVTEKLKQDIRPEDQARLIQERGDALAAKCQKLRTNKSKR